MGFTFNPPLAAGHVEALTLQVTRDRLTGSKFELQDAVVMLLLLGPSGNNMGLSSNIATTDFWQSSREGFQTVTCVATRDLLLRSFVHHARV
jgi:hypothetical protein